MPDITSNPPARIAVLRALQLGDLLCAVPALRALRAACPAATITLIGLPWARDLAERLEHIDDFIEFPGYPGLPEREPDIASLPRFLAEASERRFDLAIQMHGSGTLTNPLITMLGARRTAGFAGPDAWQPDPGWFMPWPAQLPEVGRLLALTAFLGVPPRGEHLELPIHPQEQQAFAQLRPALPSNARGYVCIHPGARLPSRRWLPERFAQVADRLARAGFGVVLTGSSDEAPLTAEVSAAMRSPATDLAGRTSLGTLAALVEHARLVVCNDTGMSHVAAATGTPSVVVCCGADPQRWRPLDETRHRVLWHPVDCRPCSHVECPLPGHDCAAAVSAATVADLAMQLLADHGEIDHAAA